MYIYRPHSKLFNTRREIKSYLGGTNRFNRALKNGDLKIMNYESIAVNGTLHNSE